MAIFSGNKRDVYLAVAEKYGEYIRLGILKEGERLPSVRTVAGELGINPNTVQKAYMHLEEIGYIKSMPKKGAFVVYSEAGGKNSESSMEIRLGILKAKEDGISRADILSIIEEVYKND